MNRAERRRVTRQLNKERRTVPDALSKDKEFIKKVEEGFMALGEMNGITYMEQLYKQRFVKEVPKIQGIGPKRFVELARALGIEGITEKEYKK